MQDTAILEDISGQLDKAEADIAYYNYHISCIDEGLESPALPDENKTRLMELKSWALRKIQEIRLAQVLMLEEQRLKEIIISN